MVKTKYKPYFQKIISIFIIALLFCISIKYFIQYITSKNLPVTVVVTAEIKQDDTFQLFYTKTNSRSPFNETDSIKKEVKQQDGFQTIKFDLPYMDTKSLRLDLGTKPGEIVIKDIKLKNIIHTYVFNPENIIDKFKSANDIKKSEVKDGLVYISSTGNNPYIINADISYVLQLLNSKKIVMVKRILAVLLCLIFSTIVTLILKLIYILIINYKKLIEKIAEVLHNFLKYKDLLYELVIRDIKVKYKKSVLGLLWSLLNPLFMMIVMTIVFSNLFRFDIKNFPIYLLTGQIIFTFMSESTNMAMNSILGNSSLIKKVYIPKYIFPLSKVLSSFVNLLFSLAAVIIVMIITKTKITFTVFLFPLSFIYILLFCIGLGFILSAYVVFFRDIIYLYGIFLTAWTYFTPIFYPVSIIPEKYKAIIYYNPMYYYIEYFRDIILYSKVPSVQLNLICLGISCVSLIIGCWVFYKNQNKFILYI